MFTTTSQESLQKPVSLVIDNQSKSTLSMLERAERVSRTFEASLYNKMTALGQLLNRAETLEKKLQEKEDLLDSANKKVAALEGLVSRAEIAAARLQTSETLVSTVDHLAARIDRLAEQSGAFEAAVERNREDLEQLAKQTAVTEQRVHIESEIVSGLDRDRIAVEQTMGHLTVRIDQLAELSAAFSAAVKRNTEELDRLAKQTADASALKKQMDEGAAMSSKLEQKIADLEQEVRQSNASSVLNTESRRQQDILRLNAKGVSPREIAEALEMHIGEVQLILSLKLEPKVTGSTRTYGVTPLKVPAPVKKITR